jgi:hypothetical protein
MPGSIEEFGRWRAIVERVFPQGSRVIEVPVHERQPESDWQLLVSWRLRTEASRPGKRSKIVNFVVAGQAQRDYMRLRTEAKCYADNRLEDWLRARLDRFDADHDTYEGFEPPVVTWFVGRDVLYG